MVACSQGFPGPGLQAPSTPTPSPASALDGPLPRGFPVLGSLAFLRDQTLHNCFAGSGCWGWGGRCRAPLQPWCVCGGGRGCRAPQGSSPALAGVVGGEAAASAGAWLLRMEAEGEEGWGLGTSATPVLSGEEEEEEQLLTCLSAQLFVSRSPRETEAAGSRKSCRARPARLLPRPYVLTPSRTASPGGPQEGLPPPTSEGLLWGPCACLCRADTRKCHPRPRRGSAHLLGSGRAGSSPGGSVLTRDRGQRGGQRSRWGSVLPGGRITGEQGSPWRQVRQGSTSLLAQTFPGPCLLCLPCELPSPWGQSR